MEQREPEKNDEIYARKMIASLKERLKDNDVHHNRYSDFALGRISNQEMRWLGRVLTSLIGEKVGNIGEANDDFNIMWDKFDE